MNAFRPADLPDENEGGLQLTTPADLRSLRLLLGIEPSQMAHMLSVPVNEIRTLESMRTFFVYRGHAEMLESLLSRVNDLIDNQAEDNAPAPDFLIQYPNDAVFRIYEPELSEWMQYNSVHQMFISRLLDEWLRSGHQPVVATLVPAQYDEFLQANEIVDSDDARTEWARAHIKVIKQREGMPPGPRGRPHSGARE